MTQIKLNFCRALARAGRWVSGWGARGGCWWLAQSQASLQGRCFFGGDGWQVSEPLLWEASHLASFSSSLKSLILSLLTLLRAPSPTPPVFGSLTLLKFPLGLFQF